MTDDERDREISRRAGLAGAAAVFLALVAVCMAPSVLRGPESSVTLTAGQLAFAPWGAWMLLYAVHSVVTIRLYRQSRG